MPQTILFAYKGAANGHIRVLASYPTYLAERCYLAINTSGYLGILIDSVNAPVDFHATGFAVPDNVWTTIGATLSGTTVCVFANSSRLASFTVASSVESALVSCIGNLTPNRVITAATGLAPSLTLAPSLNLAPADNAWEANASANGIIDEVQRYDTVLSDSDIGAAMQALSQSHALPTFPLADGYDDSPQDNILRSSMSSGPVKSRLRSTVAPRIIQCQYHLDTYQKQILEQFYASVGGVNPFYWTTPDTGETLTVTFEGKPQCPIDGLGYRAMMALRVAA